MYYSVIRTGMENALPSAPGFAELAGTQDIADEAGRVSTAAATLFINCRLGVAPSSIHSLIMGPNMIKSVRLNDLFATTAVWEIVMTFVLKVSFPSAVHPARHQHSVLERRAHRHLLPTRRG